MDKTSKAKKIKNFTTTRGSETVKQLKFPKTVLNQGSSSTAQDSEERVTPIPPEILQVARDIARKEAREEAQQTTTKTFGTYVALFTFVSIQIQVFSQVTELSRAITFTVLIFLCMIGFLFFLDLILGISKRYDENGGFFYKYFVPLIPLISLIVIGVLIFIGLNQLYKHDIPLSFQEDKYTKGLEDKINSNTNKIQDHENTINTLEYTQKLFLLNQFK